MDIPDQEVPNDCRHCGQTLPEEMIITVNESQVHQFHQLNQNICDCNAFIHEDCLLEEAYVNPLRCPECHTPWRNLLVLQRPVSSFKDLEQLFGNRVRSYPFTLSFIAMALFTQRFVPSVQSQTRTEYGISLLASTFIYLLSYSIITMLILPMAKLMHVKITEHIDIGDGVHENECRICLESVNDILYKRHKKVFPRKYFCACNEYTCETCIRELVKNQKLCMTCKVPNRWRNVRRVRVPVSYLKFRQTQSIYETFSVTLTIGLLLVWYVIETLISDQNRGKFWQKVPLYLCLVIFLAMMVMEMVYLPILYWIKRWNNSLESRRQVIIRDLDQGRIVINL